MTNRRVVFLSRLFYPHIGGVETHVLNISLELIKRGYSVTVVTEQFDEHTLLEESYKGIKIYRIPRQSCKSKLGVWFWMLSNMKLFLSSDIVHAHDVYWWYFPLRIILFLKPSFVTFHGWEGTFPPKRSAILVRKITEVLAKKNICIGSFIQSWYETTPDCIMFGAHDGIQTISAKKNRDMIAFVGRLDQDNDLSMYVEAFKQLKRHIPTLNITFVGDGSLSSQAKKIGKVTGFVESPSNYLQSAFWIWSSSYLSMISSMANKSIVCSLYSNPLKEEYITTFPLASSIIHAGSISVFVSTFLKLYIDKSLQKKYVQDGFEWAQNQTWKKVSDEYINLWQK